MKQYKPLAELEGRVSMGLLALYFARSSLTSSSTDFAASILCCCSAMMRTTVKSRLLAILYLLKTWRL